MPIEREAQLILDDAQRRFLGPRPTRERIVAWCNACINSGTGPIADRFGDVAVAGVLQLWSGTVAEKIARAAPPSTKPETGA